MIDLQPFCRKPGNCRYAISIPYVKDSLRCATDGHIAVATPAPGEPDTPAGKGPFPDLASVIVRPPPETELLTWPPSPKFVSGNRDCPKCDGEGDIPNKTGNNYHRCRNCNRTGSVTDPQRYAIISPTVTVDGRYWRLLAGLPYVEWYQPYPLGAIYFRFDGGEGALMPVTEAK